MKTLTSVIVASALLLSGCATTTQQEMQDNKPCTTSLHSIPVWFWNDEQEKKDKSVVDLCQTLELHLPDEVMECVYQRTPPFSQGLYAGVKERGLKVPPQMRLHMLVNALKGVTIHCVTGRPLREVFQLPNKRRA